jgi:hypothetical protein
VNSTWRSERSKMSRMDFWRTRVMCRKRSCCPKEARLPPSKVYGEVRRERREDGRRTKRRRKNEGGRTKNGD